MSTDIWSYTCYIIAFAVYLNTLTAEFVYDDRRAILTNQDVNSNNAFSHLWYNDFWGTPLASTNSHGSYRPLCVLTFRLNHLLFGYRPLAYHLTNVLLHVVSTALVLKLGKCLLPQRAARYGALLFAVHPVHAEAVAGVVGRADVISCIFYLLTVLCYMRHRDAESHDDAADLGVVRYCHHAAVRHKAKISNQLPADCWGCVDMVRRNAFLALSVLFGCLAAFCKETGFTALPVCLLYEILLLHRLQLRLWTKTSHWKNIEVLALSSATLLMVRVKLSGFYVPTFSAADNPIAKSDFLARLLTFLYLPVFNFKLFLFPYTLSFDWGMDSVPKVASIFDARNCLSFAFYYLLHIVVRTAYARTGAIRSTTNQHQRFSLPRHQQQQLAPLFLVLFAVVSFLPASNLFFYVGFVVAERILYIPSVGLCLLIGYGYHIISNRTTTRRSRASLHFVFAFSIFALAVRCVLRNNDWQNEEKLYKSNVGINPPKAYGNLGSVLSDEGRLAEAEVAFRAALKYRFNMADVHYNLAMLLEKTNRADEAVASYNLAIKFRPSLAVAYLKLGQLLTKMNRDDEAKRLLFLCSRLDSAGLKDPKLHETAKIEALVNLALIESKNARYQKALSIYLEAILSAPAYYKSQALYNSVGETFIKMEKYEEAEKWFRYVTGEIEFERHGFSNLNSFANYSDFEPSKWRVVIRKYETFEHPYIYLQYSQLLFDLKKYRKAAEILRKVINVMPEDPMLIRKMAHVCKIAGLLAEAEEYYRRVTYLHSDASSFSDLGAILYLRGKYAESEIAYKHSLTLNPTDRKIERILFELKCILYNRRSNATELRKTIK